MGIEDKESKHAEDINALKQKIGDSFKPENILALDIKKMLSETVKPPFPIVDVPLFCASLERTTQLNHIPIRTHVCSNPNLVLIYAAKKHHTEIEFLAAYEIQDVDLHLQPDAKSSHHKP